VRDPRDENARHPLASVLFCALAATLCGAKTCVDIADFVEANFETLAEIVELPHGAPSHDLFSRIFRLLDPAELATALERFALALREGLGLGPPKGVVAIDGKSLRRGYERGKAHFAPLMVGVWDSETKLSLSSRRADGGSEVATTLAILKALVLKGCTVTADALHCNKEMAKAVRNAGAHYALTLKGNRSTLHAAALSGFAQAEGSGALAVHETLEKGHDREESRRVSVIAVPSDAPDFPGLAAIARIQSERRMPTGKIETDTRFVALSRKLSPRRVLEITRAHWSIENNLHWQLDVSFNEDDARTRKDYGPQNLAVIRRMALDILRAHPDSRSIARKMKLAAWRKDFFFELFAYMR
jgi:predicted transposase YbfD/YdcC